MNPEQQFKKFLICIVLIVGVVIFIVIKPDFVEMFDKDGALMLSSEKPWQEELAEDENEIDDVEIELSLPENQFKKESSNNPFKFELSQKDDDEYWVTGSIPINPMTDINRISRKDLFLKRKQFVEKSIFKNRNYRPSEAVFGQVADKKPWMSIEALTCTGKGSKANVGVSEETRYINNPTLLIGLDRLSFDEKSRNLCSAVDYLMPIKINYSKDENTIKTVFEVSAYKGELGRNFLLKGLNARDLGFKYIYADSTSNILFTEVNNNVTNKIYTLKDFIQLGSVCGVKGGCNNGSPNQKELNFAALKYPASIHLKLWKKQPKSVDDKTDINYLIILK